MSKNDREIHFTPNTVGPGNYYITKESPLAELSAPFLKWEKRSSSIRENGSLPGPRHPGTKGFSSFTDSTPRNLLETKKITPVRNNVSTPGVSKLPELYKGSVSLSVELTPVSIPTRRVDITHVGPATYDPKYTITKPKPVGVNIKKPKIKLSPVKLESLVPVHYTTVRKNHKITQKSRYFSSLSKREGSSNELDAPGLGTYEKSMEISCESLKPAGLGSSTKRLSKDPHRPYIASNDSRPSIGHYFTRDQLKNIEQLRHHFISASVKPRKPQFGSPEQRKSRLFLPTKHFILSDLSY